MLYTITHKTTYDYGDVVPECFNIVRLYPRPIFDQVCLDHRLEVVPKPIDRKQRQDYFGNTIEQFSIQEPHDHLVVTAVNRIKVTPRAYPPLESTPAWETIAELNATTDLMAVHFTKDSPHIRASQEIREYALQSFSPGQAIAESSQDLTKRIFDDFEFDSEATTVSTPVDEVFKKKAGVCQDFAHFQIACFRSLNLPARYVSGYIRTTPPPGEKRLVGADASHAWVSVYCGESGWFDFDPTNNLIPATDHVTIGWGRDYSDICPIQGVFTGGGETIMSVSVDVLPEDSEEDD